MLESYGTIWVCVCCLLSNVNGTTVFTHNREVLRRARRAS